MPKQLQERQVRPSKYGLLIVIMITILSFTGIKVKCIGCTDDISTKYKQCSSILQVKLEKPPRLYAQSNAVTSDDKDAVIKDLVEYIRKLDKHYETMDNRQFDAIIKFDKCITTK